MNARAIQAADSPSDNGTSEPGLREIRYEHSLNLGPILDRFCATLLVSTYQAGKLGVIGRDGDQLTFSFHNFERSMGVAVREAPSRWDRLARSGSCGARRGSPGESSRWGTMTRVS